MPSDLNPEIPDSISFKELSNYLHDKPHFPLSSIIPELNLGGPDGGICDLQFAIMQLIQRSTDGCNIVQLLSASIHLMMEVEHHFADQVRRAEAELPPFNEVSPAERAEVASILRGIILNVKASSGIAEELFSTLTHNFGMRRVKSIADHPEVHTPSDFRSRLLISDELLDCLQLERDSVTRYLGRAAETL